MKIIRFMRSVPRKLIKKGHRVAFYTRAMKCSAATIKKGKRARFTKKTDHEILILGNGPSLNELELERLVSPERDFLCVNFFANRSEQFAIIKPRYYVLLDPIFFDANTKQQDVLELFSVLEKVDWKMTVVLAQGEKLPIRNQYIRYEYIATSEINSYLPSELKVLDCLYRNNLAVCGLQNVLCGALHYCILKRFPCIYLAGCDMNEFMAYSVDGRNHVLRTTRHFYGEDVKDFSERENNPIRPGMFHEWLGYYVNMLKQFYHYSKFAEAQGVKVYNLTENSYIDCFEKIDWHTLVR